MEINKKKLQEALEIVKPGLASKEMIVQSTSFAFMNGKVVTYNDEISVSHPVDDLEIEGAIQAEQLYKILGKLKKDTIEAEIVKGEKGDGVNQILLKAGKAKMGLTLQSEIKLPLKGIFTTGDWHDLPEHFVKLVSFAANSAGYDMAKPILTCVHVNEKGFVEASDGIRITKGEFGEEMPIPTFLLPATSAGTMVKLKPIQIATGKGWVHFKTEVGTVLSCRVYDRDAYPPTDHLFVIDGVEIMLPKGSNPILDKAMVFAKREHQTEETVDLELGNGILIMRSKSESGWFEEETRMRYKGESIIFSISPHLLKEILDASLTCLLSPDRIKFKGENWVYIAMLKHKPKKKEK